MWVRCLARATFALVGLGLLSLVASAAGHPPPALAPAGAASAGALAAIAPNPMEADMVALVTATPVAVAAAPVVAPAVVAPAVVVPAAPAARPAPAPAPQVAAAAHRAPSAPPASLHLAAVSPPAVAAPPLPAAARAVQTALKELGKPYRYGALGPGTFDCSGLTKFAYSAAGISLPHSAAAQYQSGRRVNRNQLQPGDLIFWRGLDHVGLYIGNGKMVHAPRTGEVVTIISIDQGGYLGAVRPGT